MAEEESKGRMEVSRVFEQPADAISSYSDFAQIFGTGHEVMLQFYESIPGPPGPGGAVQIVRSRLRATIVVSLAHAANIGRLLLQQIEGKSPEVQARKLGDKP